MQRADRLIVLPEHRIVFLPVPKSGCTSVKWWLAGLLGIPRERFLGSRARDVSPATGIHDMDRWDPAHRWDGYDETEHAEMTTSDDWLRFAVVRDPAARLWSAWQSKILLQEPRYVTRFGDEPWFPDPPTSLDGVVESFRAFVRALDGPADAAPHDSHWAVQYDLVAELPLNFLGRAEDPPATWRRLRDHVAGRGTLPADVPRENASPIPYHPHVYDAATAAILHRRYAVDFSEFGYREVDASGATGGASPDAWREQAAHRMPVVRELIERHRRIGELLEMLRDSETRAQRLEQRLERSVEREKEARRAARAATGETLGRST